MYHVLFYVIIPNEVPVAILQAYISVSRHISKSVLIRRNIASDLCDTAADPAPRGAYRGRAPSNDCLCPPKRKLCPPKRGLCPEEFNRLGATGVQIEAQIDVFCGLTPDFMTFLG